jgi:hypothetical protein
MRRSLWRRGERFVLGVTFVFVAWIIERRVLTTIRRRGEVAPSLSTPLAESVSEVERPVG